VQQLIKITSIESIVTNAHIIRPVTTAVTAFLFFMLSFKLNELFDSELLFVTGVNLIFIPAGVKLLCLLVGGVPAAIGLFLSSVYLSLTVWKDLPLISIIYFGIISIASYYSAVYGVVRYFKIHRDLSNLKYHHIIVLSAAASLLNGFSHNVVYWTQGVTTSENFLAKSSAMAFGDFFGCFTVVMLFNLAIACVGRLSQRRFN
jgi:hypothetical protein